MGVRKGIDIGRLARAAKSPGVDPRIVVTFAVVEDVAFDADHGMFADVQYQPDGQRTTVFVGGPYAGPGYGSWGPVRKGDTVLIAVSMGDPAAGGVLVSRVWSADARPPSQFGADGMDPTEDPTIVVEPGRTLRVIARDGSSVRLEADGGGKIEVIATGAATVEVKAEAAIILDSSDVRLGSGAGAPVARIGDLVALTVPLPSPLTPTSVVGQIVSGSSVAKA